MTNVINNRQWTLDINGSGLVVALSGASAFTPAVVASTRQVDTKGNLISFITSSLAPASIAAIEDKEICCFSYMRRQLGDLGVLRGVNNGFSEEARTRGFASLTLVRFAFVGGIINRQEKRSILGCT